MNDYPELTEKQVSTELIYDGKIIKLYRDEAELPDGNRALREVVRHPGAVCVVPLTDEGEVLCVKQFRYPFETVTLEIPAGKLDHAREDHREAALRELREETGASASELIYLGELWTSPAILSEVIYMYCAKGLTYGDTDFDDDEFIAPERVKLGTLVDMIMNNEVPDAKTQAAVLKVARMLGK